jgi:hypothetical protein
MVRKLLLLGNIMIPKVTSSEFHFFPPALKSTASEGPGSVPFQTMLEDRLAAVPPLEGLVLSLLVEIINKIMAKGEGESLPFYGLPPLSEGPGPSPSLNTPDAVPPEGPGPGRPAAESNRQEIDGHIQEAAARHGVEADLVRAVIEVESRFDPRAVSPAGARGLMQLMPATAADLGVQHPFDPGQNITGGTRYLKQLLDRYGGNRRLALAAYNWGMGNLERKPEALPRETRQYLQKVEKAYERFAGASRARAAGLA